MEGLPEFAVEYRIDYRIEGRIAVPEPKNDPKHFGRHLETCQRRDRINGEEGQPAPDEGRHDDPKNQGGTPLSRPRQFALGLRRFQNTVAGRRRRVLKVVPLQVLTTADGRLQSAVGRRGEGKQRRAFVATARSGRVG